MQVAPSGGHASSATWWPNLKAMQIALQFGTSACGATWWSNFELIQVEPHTIGQMAFYLAGEILKLKSQYPGSVVSLVMFIFQKCIFSVYLTSPSDVAQSCNGSTLYVVLFARCSPHCPPLAHRWHYKDQRARPYGKGYVSPALHRGWDVDKLRIRFWM